MQFPFSVEFGVRGYEIDIWHHVNNAVYLQWLEHARWSLVTDTEFGQLFYKENLRPVVRYVDIDYRGEIVFGDTVKITIWPRKVGNSSITLGNSIHVIKSADPSRVGRLTTVSTVVLACMHEGGGGKATIPDSIRAFFPEKDPGIEPV